MMYWILAIIASIAWLIIVTRLLINYFRTRELRFNPKVGDPIMYKIGKDKHFGTISKVFKNIVRVDCLPYPAIIVKNGKMVVKGKNESGENIYKSVTRTYRNISKSEIYCVIY